MLLCVVFNRVLLEGRPHAGERSSFWQDSCEYHAVFVFPTSEYLPGGKTWWFFRSHFRPSGVGLRVWPFLVLAFSDFLFEMGSSGFLSRSIDVKLGVFPDKPSDSDVAKSLWDFFNETAQFKVVAIQRCPNRIARVTFEVGGEAVLSDFLEGETILVRGVECEVTFPAPPVENVLVYHFPYEKDDRQVKEVLSRYGSIKNVTYQSWTNLEGVHTGTRIVKMDRTDPIPRSLMIGSYRCKIWYRSQAVICDACREAGHVAAKCPVRGNCFHCHQPGHMARDCPVRSDGRRAWGQPSGSVSGVSVSDGAAGGGPPAVEAPCTEQVSVGGSSLPMEDDSPGSSLLSASSFSVGEDAPDCRGSPSSASNVASGLSDVSGAASVCNSKVVDANGLLMDKISNGNCNVSNIDNAMSNASGDPPFCSVSNVPNAGKESCIDNVNNSDNVSASAGCSDSGVPLFGPAVGVASDSPPSSGDSEMLSLSRVRKRPASESPLEDSLAPADLPPGSVSKEVGVSKVSRKNPGGRGHHRLPASVAQAAVIAISRPSQ